MQLSVDDLLPLDQLDFLQKVDREVEVEGVVLHELFVLLQFESLDEDFRDSDRPVQTHKVIYLIQLHYLLRLMLGDLPEDLHVCLFRVPLGDGEGQDEDLLQFGQLLKHLPGLFLLNQHHLDVWVDETPDFVLLLQSLDVVNDFLQVFLLLEDEREVVVEDLLQTIILILVGLVLEHLDGEVDESSDEDFEAQEISLQHLVLQNVVEKSDFVSLELFLDFGRLFSDELVEIGPHTVLQRLCIRIGETEENEAKFLQIKGHLTDQEKLKFQLDESLEGLDAEIEEVGDLLLRLSHSLEMLHVVDHNQDLGNQILPLIESLD